MLGHQASRAEPARPAGPIVHPRRSVFVRRVQSSGQASDRAPVEMVVQPQRSRNGGRMVRRH